MALLEKGADLTKRTKKGEQPLHCAAEKGHVDAVGVLLDAPGCDVNAPGPYKATPLHVASTPAVAELLLSRGADPSIKYRGRTPSTHHTEKGNSATARAIQSWDPSKAAIMEQKRKEQETLKLEEEEAESKAMEAAAQARQAAAAKAAEAKAAEAKAAEAKAAAAKAEEEKARSSTPAATKRHWESSAGSPTLARAAADEAEELDSDSEDEIVEEEVVEEVPEEEDQKSEPEKLSPKTLAPLGGLQPLKHTGGLPSLAPLGGTLSAGSSLGDPFTPGMGRTAPGPSPVASSNVPNLDSPPLKSDTTEAGARGAGGDGKKSLGFKPDPDVLKAAQERGAAARKAAQARVAEQEAKEAKELLEKQQREAEIEKQRLQAEEEKERAWQQRVAKEEAAEAAKAREREAAEAAEAAEAREREAEKQRQREAEAEERHRLQREHDARERECELAAKSAELASAKEAAAAEAAHAKAAVERQSQPQQRQGVASDQELEAQQSLSMQGGGGGGAVRALRFALKYVPPTIILEYGESESRVECLSPARYCAGQQLIATCICACVYSARTEVPATAQRRHLTLTIAKLTPKKDPQRESQQAHQTTFTLSQRQCRLQASAQMTAQQPHIDWSFVELWLMAPFPICIVASR